MPAAEWTFLAIYFGIVVVAACAPRRPSTWIVMPLAFCWPLVWAAIVLVQ